MRGNIFIIGTFFLAGLFFSCKKNPVLQSSGEPQWIKVIADSSVYFTGKIRADAQNNLFCSYNYRDYQVDSNSAIIKLNSDGSIVWRREFTDLAIYDFVVTPGGIPVIVSYSDGMILFIELTDSGKDSISVSFPVLSSLPPDQIKNLMGIKIFSTPVGVYHIIGSVNYSINGTPGYKQKTIGFMAETSQSGALNWLQNYSFPPDSEAVSITGCEQASDGFILFGNMQKDRRRVNDVTPSKTISSFFIMKTSATGDSAWLKNYNTSSYDSSTKTYSGYYSSTTDILAADGDNFFACTYNTAFNIFPLPIYTGDDNSARIFKITSQGILLDSTRINFGQQNEVADFAKKKDGGLLIGFNPSELGRIANHELVGIRNSFVANVSSDLTLQNVALVQSQFTDYLGSVCALPDGHCAIEMMIQSFGSDHYKLEVIKTDENGNF